MVLLIPSPGEKVARPNEVRKSGSEEECGRKSESLHSVTDLTKGWTQDIPWWRSSGFPNFKVTARIPLQSPIGSEEPIGDSFPPGEAFGVRDWRLWIIGERQWYL